MSLRVLIPGTGKELLRKELELAFANAGCAVAAIAPDLLRGQGGASTLKELAGHGQALLFCVNFQGLEGLPALLEGLGAEQSRVRIAAWCVDNPWNLLSGARHTAWQGINLFVTDKSFVAPLKAYGAQRVHHLPLAASFALFAPNKARDAAFPPPVDLAPFVFVGRSAFPGKERFFAGARLPGKLIKTARAMLKKGERPDLVWWEAQLAADSEAYGAPASKDASNPAKGAGCAARQSALGAEEANLCWRAFCLKAAAGSDGKSLDVYGDNGWKGILPAGARLREPVDYYARLPGIYAAAPYSLALTSLQLPSGLNQRHFDVWAAGGLCLTDNTPGLHLFPEELTRPVTFCTAENITATAEALEKAHNRETLGQDWQNHLRAHHTYEHRVESILRAMGLA